MKGIIRIGQVIVIGPTDLPDGTEVEILPLGLSAVDDQAQMNPVEIAWTLAAMERIEPFDMIWWMYFRQVEPAGAAGP